MEREQIIRMAREAGFVVDEKAQQHQPNCIFHTHHMVDELLEAFAAIVAAAAKAEEREACAKVCEAEASRAEWNWGNDISGNQPFWNGGEQLASSCASAIRARGQA